jgi:hypothetical protein
MSTSPISTLGQAIGQGGSGGGDVQSQSQAPTPTQAGPVQVGITQAAPAPSQPQPPAAPAPKPGGSRLSQILGAVASVASTALSGVPDRGRPSFLSGAGEGARAEQANIANQQAIKFRTFDDQVRAAQLHNQDLELQGHTQAQADAHQAAQDAQHDWDEAHGIQYDSIPNSGQAATNYLTAQTGNGGASIPPGTHLSADGKTILIPRATSETQAGQLQKYNTFRAAYGLPSLPEGAQFVPGKYLDYLQNRLEGHKLDGNVYNHDELPGAIADLQATRDSMAKNNAASPDVLKQIDGSIGSMKAKLDYLDQHKATVLSQTSQATTAGKIAGETSPDAIAGQAKLAGAKANAEVPAKIAAQDNAAGNKNGGAGSGSIWLPKVSADEKKKAELAENIAFNANEVAKIVMNRPDILGAVAGRFTNAQQMIGNNDQDISALGVHVHNMAMANSGVHGFRSQEGVESYERQLLNNFKNGPAAMAGALRASTGSVQTFIDNARPDTYKTHSKQGGAVRGMMGGQQ